MEGNLEKEFKEPLNFSTIWDLICSRTNAMMMIWPPSNYTCVKWIFFPILYYISYLLFVKCPMACIPIMIEAVKRKPEDRLRKIRKGKIEIQEQKQIIQQETEITNKDNIFIKLICNWRKAGNKLEEELVNHIEQGQIIIQTDQEARKNAGEKVKMVMFDDEIRDYFSSSIHLGLLTVALKIFPFVGICKTISSFVNLNKKVGDSMSRFFERADLEISRCCNKIGIITNNDIELKIKKLENCGIKYPELFQFKLENIIESHILHEKRFNIDFIMMMMCTPILCLLTRYLFAQLDDKDFLGAVMVITLAMLLYKMLKKYVTEMRNLHKALTVIIKYDELIKNDTTIRNINTTINIEDFNECNLKKMKYLLKSMKLIVAQHSNNEDYLAFSGLTNYVEEKERSENQVSPENSEMHTPEINNLQHEKTSECNNGMNDLLTKQVFPEHLEMQTHVINNLQHEKISQCDNGMNDLLTKQVFPEHLEMQTQMINNLQHEMTSKFDNRKNDLLTKQVFPEHLEMQAQVINNLQHEKTSKYDNGMNDLLTKQVFSEHLEMQTHGINNMQHEKISQCDNGMNELSTKQEFPKTQEAHKTPETHEKSSSIEENDILEKNTEIVEKEKICETDNIDVNAEKEPDNDELEDQINAFDEAIALISNVDRDMQRRKTKMLNSSQEIVEKERISETDNIDMNAEKITENEQQDILANLFDEVITKNSELRCEMIRRRNELKNSPQEIVEKEKIYETENSEINFANEVETDLMTDLSQEVIAKINKLEREIRRRKDEKENSSQEKKIMGNSDMWPREDYDPISMNADRHFDLQLNFEAAVEQYYYSDFVPFDEQGQYAYKEFNKNEFLERSNYQYNENEDQDEDKYDSDDMDNLEDESNDYIVDDLVDDDDEDHEDLIDDDKEDYEDFDCAAEEVKENGIENEHDGYVLSGNCELIIDSVDGSTTIEFLEEDEFDFMEANYRGTVMYFLGTSPNLEEVHQIIKKENEKAREVKEEVEEKEDEDEENGINDDENNAKEIISHDETSEGSSDSNTSFDIIDEGSDEDSEDDHHEEDKYVYMLCESCKRYSVIEKTHPVNAHSDRQNEGKYVFIVCENCKDSSAIDETFSANINNDPEDEDEYVFVESVNYNDDSDGAKTQSEDSCDNSRNDNVDAGLSVSVDNGTKYHAEKK